MYYKSRKTLSDSEAKYRSLFDNMSHGFAYCKLLYDEEGNAADFIYLDVNPAFEELTGLKNVVGKKITEVVPSIKESNPELFEVYGRVVSTGRPEKFEIKIEPLKIWFSISAYSPESGYFVALFDNITRRVTTYATLKESERQFREMLANVNLAAMILDTEGDILFCNDYILNLTGWRREEVQWRSLFDMFIPVGHPSGPEGIVCGKHQPRDGPVLS